MTVAIPTFNRGEILLETIKLLAAIKPDPREILVVDQTPRHSIQIETGLSELANRGVVRLIKLSEPSIPHAMNVALEAAEGEFVLFLDDDIVPAKNLLEEHQKAYSSDPSLWATVGQVIQPWQESQAITAPRQLEGLMRDFDFPFHSTLDTDVENVMAGNLCVNRELAISIGGFDERFVGSAYRFETDFARRIIAAGGRIRFAGLASIEHLHADSGGTRSKGDHKTSASPQHGLGDYYYAFKHGTSLEAWRYGFRRMFREVRTRFHLKHPWWIPVKLSGEVRAFYLGRKQAKKSPRLIAAGKVIET